MHVKGASTVREKKVLEEDLNGLTRPKPNSKFLGLRLKLSIYNMFRKEKPNSFFGKIRDKNGEPPVLLREMQSYLFYIVVLQLLHTWRGLSFFL